MDVLEGEQVAKLLKNLVHEETQVHAESVHLTVRAISRLATTGSLDFGGSEFTTGEKVTLAPEKMKPDDKYGWWLLATGQYLVEYNEELTLPPQHLGIIQPLERTIESGVTHDTRFFTSEHARLLSIIHVCEGDVRIKENARISELIVLQH